MVPLPHLFKSNPLPTDVLGLLDPGWDKNVRVLLSHLLPCIRIVECALMYGVKRGSGESCLDLGGIHLAAISDLLHVGVEGNETKEVATNPRHDALLHRGRAFAVGFPGPPAALSGGLTVDVVRPQESFNVTPVVHHVV